MDKADFDNIEDSAEFFFTATHGFLLRDGDKQVRLSLWKLYLSKVRSKSLEQF